MDATNKDGEYVDFQKLFYHYLKNWKIFLVSIIFCVLGAYFYDKTTPTVYKIESKFLVEEEDMAVNPFEYTAPAKGSIDRKIANETQELKSKMMANQVLDQLRFDVEYYTEGVFKNTEIYTNIPIEVEVDWGRVQYTGGTIKITWTDDTSYQLQYTDKRYNIFVPSEEQVLSIENEVGNPIELKFDEWTELPNNRIRIKNNKTQSSGTIIIKLRHRKSLVQEYTGDKFKISLSTAESSILLLILETQQPLKGSDYLNTLMKTFLENELSSKNAEDLSQINFINEQITGISDSLSSKEQELKIFRSRNQTQNLSNEGNALYKQLSELRKSISSASYKGDYYTQLENYLARENYQDIALPSGIGIDDPVLNRLIENMISLQAEKSRFLATQTENSPNVMEVNKKLFDLNSSIKEVLKNVKNNNESLIRDMQSRIDGLEIEFRALPQTEQDLQSIQRAYTYNENLYNFLLERRAVSELSLASNKAKNRIIDPAIPNFMPLKLKKLINFVAAFTFGLILPIVFIFIKDQASVKIQDLEEVKKDLDVSVLGYIARLKKFKQLVIFDDPKGKVSESLRSVRTNINYIHSNQRSKTILFTSSVANEGKTFSALNLAGAYSTSGKKTIYVGCDLYKVHRLENINKKVEGGPTIGLSQYLSGQENDLESVIIKSKHTNFDLILPGPIPPNPVDLLVSERLQNLLNELKRVYDIIILDTPPIGLANETLPLTRHADVNIYMLRQNFSNKRFVKYINTLKVEKQLANLFVVFNDVEDKSLKYGGYGYGYGEKTKDKKS